MAKYRITGPDGATFEVNAPEGATEQQVMTYAKSQFSKMPDKGTDWLGAIRSGLQGATLGFSDELGALAAAGVAKVKDGAPFKATYEDIHGTLKHQREQFKEDSPGVALATELGGAVLTGGVAGAKMLGGKMLKNAPQWTRVAAIGAAEGGVYGAGAADPGARMQGAATGAAIGGVAAPVAGAAANRAGEIISPIAKSFAEHMRYTPNSQATEVLRKVADDAGLTVDDIVAQYQKLGKDGTLADVDENFRSLMRALSDRSGPAKREARNVLESRQMGSVDRLISTIERTTGKSAGEFADTVKGIKAERAEKARPHYDTAWSAIPSDEMFALAKSRPSLKTALKEAERLAADEGEDVATNSFKQFHYAKMALDDAIGEAKRAGKDTKARVLMNAKNDLLAAMDDAAPDYKQARDLYAGDSELINAAASGQDLLKMRPDEIDSLVAGMSSSEKELFRHGAVKAIVDKLEDSQLTHDNTRKLINSISMQRKLSALFDSPDELRGFVQQAIREREFGRTRQVVTGGSPTSQNLQGQKQLEDDAAQAFSFLDGAKGGVVTAVLRALRGKPVTPETIDEAARILLDNGLTEDQIRQIFTRSRVVQQAISARPGAANALSGTASPAANSAFNQE